jgi:cytosine-specific methyltransferase
LKFLDLFAGIGGFRLGMESAGHECVGFCEIDKYARASYKAIHNTEGEIELHDITRVTDESIRGFGSVDVICGGFPDWAFDKAQEVNSNSQLYKQAGNSVTFNVIAAIAKELL